MNVPRVLTIALTGVALAFAGCGDDEDGGDSAATTAREAAPTTEAAPANPPAGEGGAIEVSADPGGDLAYEQDSLSAAAGSATISFTNDAQTPHDVRIEKDGEDIGGTEVVSGDKAEATVELEPGEYTFYCSVGSHRQAGMEGTLTVE